MDQSSILLSVLIPTWNRAKTIEKCVRSALSTKSQRIEVIVCDNCSTDSSWQKICGLASQDPRLRIYRHGQNIGPMNNWRSCLRRARGELVHFLWSDDWVESNAYDFIYSIRGQPADKIHLLSAEIYSEELGRSIARYAYPTGDYPKQWCLKKLLGRKSAFPLSPAAWILPRHCCVEALTKMIPPICKIDCWVNAIGPDLNMITESLRTGDGVVKKVSKKVYFRCHEGSISGKSGNAKLNAHYGWASLWHWYQLRGDAYPISSTAKSVYRLAKGWRYISRGN